MKRAILVHGWEGDPKNHWFPWLIDELEKKGFRIYAPRMPDPENPLVDIWVDYLKGEVEFLDKDTYFIGHSIGCQTIMRMLEKMDGEVGGVVFVAPFFNLPNLETKEEKEIAEPWLTRPIDFDKIKEKTSKIVCLFSDNDPDVPLSDSELFKERLGAEIVVEKGKGHFCKEDGVTELPIVLDKIYIS
ncbi:serine hydrolase family protein [archaeon]|jgi:uncharacterized protein|nr:serine hydrolase family protein [archaeon]MBT4416480.1 serine hydrolase family protein [archaeon]